MSNSENMDDFKVLNISYLCFTLVQIRCALPLLFMGFLFSLLAFFYKFMLFEFQVKDKAGTIDHV